MSSESVLDEILAFNREVLAQALHLLELHALQPAASYAQGYGPHLRHVIEHYEALIHAAPGSAIAYDRRERDLPLQSDPQLARRRLLALDAAIQAWNRPASEPLTVLLRGRLDGRVELASPSSLARELMFLAGHAIHHYALIASHASAQGLPLPEGFGKAPATAHHQAHSALASAA